MMVSSAITVGIASGVIADELPGLPQAVMVMPNTTSMMNMALFFFMIYTSEIFLYC
jgi:hypothetical protein